MVSKRGKLNHTSAWCQKEANETIRQHGVKKRQIKPYVSMVSKRGKLNHTSAWCQKEANETIRQHGVKKGKLNHT
jgi:hypothetical protein